MRPRLDEWLGSISELRAGHSKHTPQKPFWPWRRGDYRMASGHFERTADNGETYNVFSEDGIYLRLAELRTGDEEKTSKFLDDFGPLGLIGWYFKMPGEKEISHRRQQVPSRFDGNIGLGEAELPLWPLEDFVPFYYPLLEGADRTVATMSMVPPDTESLYQLKIEAQRMHDLLDLLSVAQSKESDPAVLSRSFRPILPDMSEMFTKRGSFQFIADAQRLTEGNHNLAKMSGGEIKIWAKQMMLWSLSSSLQDVTLSVSPALTWEYIYQPGPPSLLPAIYLQLAFDVVQGQQPRRCENESCSSFFVPARSDQRFCNDYCREAQKQRRLRRRRKERDQISI